MGQCKVSTLFHSILIMLCLSSVVVGCSKTTPQTPILFSTSNKPSVTSEEISLFFEAERWFKAGQYARASSYYARLVDLYPKEPYYLYKLGDALRYEEHYALALTRYKEALASEGVEAALALNIKESIGLTLMLLGSYDEAAQLFTSMLAEDPTRWSTINAIARVYALQGNMEDGLQYYDVSLVIKPDHAATLNEVGLALSYNENYKDAITVLKKGSSLAETEVEQRNIDHNLALVYGLNGQIREADKVSRRHAGKLSLYNKLGLEAKLSGDKTQARAFFRSALLHARRG